MAFNTINVVCSFLCSDFIAALLEPIPATKAYCRLPESGFVRILPVRTWSTSALRPKFIVVEMQLLIQIMKSNEQMHRNYATMRDKMTN